jgi:hypothetical protein
VRNVWILVYQKVEGQPRGSNSAGGLWPCPGGRRRSCMAGHSHAEERLPLSSRMISADIGNISSRGLRLASRRSLVTWGRGRLLHADEGDRGEQQDQSKRFVLGLLLQKYGYSHLEKLGNGSLKLLRQQASIGWWKMNSSTL